MNVHSFMRQKFGVGVLLVLGSRIGLRAKVFLQGFPPEHPLGDTITTKRS